MTAIPGDTMWEVKCDGIVWKSEDGSSATVVFVDDKFRVTGDDANTSKG